MAILANVLVVAFLGLMPADPVAGPVGQTVTVVPDGGTVLLGGLKAIPVPTSVVQTTVVVPDGGTIRLGGLKRLSGSVAPPAAVVPDGGTSCSVVLSGYGNPASLGHAEPTAAADGGHDAGFSEFTVLQRGPPPLSWVVRRLGSL